MLIKLIGPEFVLKCDLSYLFVCNAFLCPPDDLSAGVHVRRSWEERSIFGIEPTLCLRELEKGVEMVRSHSPVNSLHVFHQLLLTSPPYTVVPASLPL